MQVIRRSDVGTASSSLAMIVAGAIVAVVPATAQAIASRAYTTGEQAHIAIALGVGVLLSGVSSAAVIEARLADPTIAHKSYIPWWSTAAGVLSGILLLFAPVTSWAVVFAMPLAMASLQMGRLHAISDHRWRGELATAAVLGVGCLSAFLVGTAGVSWAFLILAAAIIAAVAIRAIGVPSHPAEHVDPRKALWVASETAIVASMPLILNSIVLGAISAEAAVGFRLILTVLGILQPVLGYMRTRLLRATSVRMVLFLSTLTMLTLIAVIVADLLGLFAVIFSTSWAYVGFVPLVLACIWKALSVPATLPFTRMRREGRVTAVFWARAASNVIYLAMGATAAHTAGTLESVFAALIVAEAATMVLFTVLARSVRQAPAGSGVDEDAA
ncbi:hypothetical protein LK09_03180 [Microbacterium mangrovi]|uniref:Polysaccharide biosynthesis protein C-terminal domain-containing protein n=1 Tax=Microbacterium mangrovi TaxID=1348253 RepID=A0A0B2AC46_9MICO|nr:hypothetical protein [Microbacterium mangrovi]KHK99303.1 hypothetical protein LK09_03180 [Microbacterium mangrovi]